MNMKKIYDIHGKNKLSTSDINEHLDVLKEYASECSHITEMGVRWVVSTYSLLAGNPKVMVSYDICRNPNVDKLLDDIKECNIEYTFIETDVLQIDIDNTEMLFIDTLHTYNQLFAELNKHSSKVSKYIILHDTYTFGYKDESIYDHASKIIKNENITKQGLINAISDFLDSDIGNTWFIHKQYNNNNGLTILKKRV